jgi:hypothetical protein
MRNASQDCCADAKICRSRKPGKVLLCFTGPDGSSRQTALVSAARFF